MSPAQRQIALRKMALPVIPDDWEIVTVGTIAQKKSNSIVGGPFGSDLVSTDYVPAGVPVIRGQNMGQAFVSGEFVFVSDEKAKALSSNLAAPGDVVFTQRGTLGQVSVVPDSPFDRYLISQSQMKLSVDPQRFDVAFLCYYFSSAAGQQQILESAIQTGVPHTNLTILRGYFLPRPPPPEQQAIAAALSDADGVVAGLERAIAKKRLIKQGAMQDLLTARRRLPGFSGEWVQRKLGTVAMLQRGFDLPSSIRQDGVYPVVYSNGVMATHSAFMCEGPGVVTGRSGTIGNVTFVARQYWPHNTALWVKNFFGNSPRFIYYLLEFIDLRRFASGSGVPTLNRNDAHDDIVSVPKDIDEQKAICGVLDDMDAEIQTLESRLVKAQAVKEGMMQNFLTGRVRLV